MDPRPPKRHHHTAPKVYLRGFTDDQQRVTVRRRSGAEQNLHINNVTVRNGFYNVRNIAGVLHDDVENWFMREIESPAGPVLHRLRETDDAGVVDGSDASMIGNFVAAQLYRTATIRSYLRQIDEHIAPLLMVNEISREHGFDPLRVSPRRLAQLLRPAVAVFREEQDPNEVRASQLRTMVREIDKMMTRLRTWRWEVVVAKYPRLITGDAPAVAIQLPNGGFSGVLPPGSPVYLPLTPTRLLIGTEGRVGGPTELTMRLARVVNQRIGDEADDAVMKATSQDWPKRFRFQTQPPQLAAPTIRMHRPTSDDAPTFPARYPAPESPSIRALLATLDASDIVE